MHPKKIELIARALIIQDTKVLLCQNRERGYWYLPGGHIEPGEAAADALKREILEELGETCRVGPLLLTHELRFVQQRKPRHEVSLVFRVERKRKAAPKSQERDIEFAFFDSNSIEAIDLKPKSMVEWIRTQSAFWLSE